MKLHEGVNTDAKFNAQIKKIMDAVMALEKLQSEFEYPHHVTNSQVDSLIHCKGELNQLVQAYVRLKAQR